MKFLKNKINIVIALLIVIMIVLILFSSQRENKSKIENLVGQGLSPIQKVIYNISEVISNTYEGIVRYSQLVDEVEKLSEENGILRSQINSYSQLRTENDRLREILNLRSRLENYEFLGANIIGKNGSYMDEYIIDCGLKDGLKNGMVVVANGGLFGMITSVSNNWSLVSPIINGGVFVSGKVQRTNGNEGIIKGQNNNEKSYDLKMEYLPIDEDIKEGDKIVTSGLGEIYPANIPIGEVVSIENDKRNLSKSVFIKSHVNFQFISELFVILPNDEDGSGY